MVPALREQYNKEFSIEKYQAYVKELSELFPGHLEFRVAETPVFVPEFFKDKILSACETIIDVITRPEYKMQR